jgi:mannose-6-phosphate isomerase
VDRLTPPVRRPAGFGVVVVTDGTGLLSGAHDRLPVRRGDTLLVPHAAGPVELTGECAALHLTPPADPDDGILR